jgi:flagellar basal body-associated protein FliL
MEKNSKKSTKIIVTIISVVLVGILYIATGVNPFNISTQNSNKNTNETIASPATSEMPASSKIVNSLKFGELPSNFVIGEETKLQIIVFKVGDAECRVRRY